MPRQLDRCDACGGSGSPLHHCNVLFLLRCFLGGSQPGSCAYGCAHAERHCKTSKFTNPQLNTQENTERLDMLRSANMFIVYQPHNTIEYGLASQQGLESLRRSRNRKRQSRTRTHTFNLVICDQTSPVLWLELALLVLLYRFFPVSRGL